MTTPKRHNRTGAQLNPHEETAYDKWFCEQVKASLDDPRPSIPAEKVEAYFARKREALRSTL